MAEVVKASVGSGAGGRNVHAISLMLASTVVFTLADAAMKLAAGVLPTGQSVLMRSAGSVVIVAVVAAWTGALAGLRRALVASMGWCCVGDAGNSLSFQAALGRMPFADIFGVLQLTPLLLTAASALLFAERVGWRRWSAVVAGLVGALLVVKPGSSAFDVWAVLALVSVLFGVLRDVATRRLDRTISPLLILMLSQSAIALLALLSLPFQPWVWPGAREWALMVVAATFTLVGHFWMILSLRTGDISAVAPFRYSGVVWALLLGLAIWGELPDALSATGMAVLVAAGLYALNRERKLAREGSGPP